MPAATRDLGLSSNRSMLVKWSEMMGWTIIGVL